MKTRFAVAWLLCCVCLAASMTSRVLADESDATAKARHEAEKAKSEAEKANYDRLREEALADQKRSDNEKEQRDQSHKKTLEDRLNAVRKWTNTQFELSERGVINRPKMTATMRRWQTLRDRELYQFLQFPERSANAIESGRALNALMVQVGPAAFQNSETRKIRPESTLPLTEAGGYTNVDSALAEQITWQDNVTGAKLTGEGSKGPLDLGWPSVLREERWKEHRKQFEDARDKALAELSSPAGLSPESDLELRESIASLNAAFAAYRRDWTSSDDPDLDRALEYQRICAGTHHIEKLVMGAYQLVERKLAKYETLGREPFEGGTIEAYMAYFQRYNLRFAPASPGHRSAYHRLFTMMVRYYMDVKMAVNLERQLGRELSEERAADLIKDIAKGLGGLVSSR
jgi:predicted  nucleic acid-binding Zn-ribbon protein